MALSAAEQAQLLSQLDGWQIETRDAIAQLEKSSSPGAADRMGQGHGDLVDPQPWRLASQ